MRGIRLWIRLAVVAAVAAVALEAAGAAAALGAPGTLTLTLLPGSLTAGSAAVLQATFTNTGPTTDSAVTLTFTFPFNVSVPLANGCVSVPGSPTRVACIVGTVGAGQAATRAFKFTVPSGTTGPVTVNGLAAFLSASPPRGGVLAASATATSYLPGQVQLPFTLPSGSTPLAAASGCVGPGGTVTATSSDQEQWEESNAQTQVTAGSPGSLPCTPIVAGVATDPGTGGADLIVKVPNGSVVTAALSFPDDFLPFSSDNDEGAGLFEYPNYPATSPQVAVPFCNSADNPAGWPGDNPVSTDSCIQSMTIDDPTDGDADQGTVVVKVTGTASDPGYH